MDASLEGRTHDAARIVNYNRTPSNVAQTYETLQLFLKVVERVA